MAAPVALYYQDGDTMDYTPGSDVAAGDVIDLGTFVGIAFTAIPANTKGSLQLKGVHNVNKYANESWSRGDKIYWDEGTKTATKTVGYQEAIMGFAFADAASGDARGLVKLWPNFA